MSDGDPTALVVDVHSHVFPAGLPDLGAETGDARWPTLLTGDDPRIVRGEEVFRRVRPACFDLAARLGELDDGGAHHQVISPVPVTFVDWAPAAMAARFHAAQNDGLAEMAARSDGRLLALGGVPLQDTGRAVDEMARAVGTLGMAGIEIPAMVDGRELDDPSLAPFWAAAADERVPVFIHPAHQRTAIRRAGQPYEFGLGMHTDTALAASALVFGGVLDRHPDLRVALAHGCGSYGWSYPRLRYMATLASGADGARLDELTRALWVDALVFDPAHIGLLLERFGPDHVMLGTDHPFLPEGFAGPLAVLDAAGAPAACRGRNALDFLHHRP